MSQYEKFVKFMDNLEKNKKELTSKLADAEDRVTLFTNELNSARALLLATDGKLAELEDKLKENPMDIGLSAEHAIWVTRKADYAGRADTLKVALKDAEKEYEQLLLKHKELDFVPYAEAATEERNAEIKNFYSEYCDKVVATAKAKEDYLEALSELNRLKNKGRNMVEAGIKSQSYAKVAKIENSAEHFSVNYRKFVVTETDVRSA